MVWGFVLLVAAAYLIGRFGLAVGPMVEVRYHASHLTWPAQAVSDVATIMFLVALVQLALLLRHIGHGELFGARVTGSLRRFAFWLFLSALVSIVGPTLVELATVDHRSGGAIHITADLRDLFYLVASLVLFLVARVIEEAAGIDAELREIV